MPYDAVLCDVTDCLDRRWVIVPNFSISQTVLKLDAAPDSIESFIRHQPEFISQYYSNIAFHDSKFGLFDQINEANTILIASDDGAVPKQGSIDFVMADDKGNRYLTFWGQPSGYNPQLFRYEAC